MRMYIKRDVGVAIKHIITTTIIIIVVVVSGDDITQDGLHLDTRLA